MIYELALIKEGGLVTKATSRRQDWTRFRAINKKKRTGKASNLLRYVCRQLYAETNGLGLWYNDLTFRFRPGRGSSTVYDLFDRFYKSCLANMLVDIRRFMILDLKTQPSLKQVNPERLLSPPLIQFCRLFPKTTVVVGFNWLWRSDKPEDTEYLMYLSKTLASEYSFPFEGGCFIAGRVERFVENFPDVDYSQNVQFTCFLVFWRAFCLW
jgi:hypothetical protein